MLASVSGNNAAMDPVMETSLAPMIESWSGTVGGGLRL